MKSTLALAVLLCIAVVALFPNAEAKEVEVSAGSDADAEYMSTELEAIKPSSRKLMESESNASNELDRVSGSSANRGLSWSRHGSYKYKYAYKKYNYYYYDHGKKYYYLKPYYYYHGKKYYSLGYYYRYGKKYYYYKKSYVHHDY